MQENTGSPFSTAHKRILKQTHILQNQGKCLIFYREKYRLFIKKILKDVIELKKQRQETYKIIHFLFLSVPL